MSAGIPDKFRIDFSRYARDMTAKAHSRLLSQFKASPVLKQFLAAFVRGGPQWAYDEIVRQQEANTLHQAAGENLDAIGRIVGQPRNPYRYDDSRWLFADRAGQGADQAPAWVRGAALASYEPVADGEYRMLILARIICNFNRFSSLPEMAYFSRFALNEAVSWRRVGPMECEILVHAGIARNKLEMLTRYTITTFADDIWMFPYPATINLTKVVFVPRKPFIADRVDGHQADAGYAAVARELTENTY